ncbi:MAG: histidine triad nucleotide-binding protein [Anaerovoracaceae bacterium]
MSDCIFCQIASGEIPGEIAYQDDRIVVFHDADPQAPVHVLMIPRKHISSINDVGEEDADLLAYMMEKIKDVTNMLGLDNGYRVVINCGEDGLQTVQHLHFHILGKRKLTWPPG